jgi:hypothetical protein
MYGVCRLAIPSGHPNRVVGAAEASVAHTPYENFGLIFLMLGVYNPSARDWNSIVLRE